MILLGIMETSSIMSEAPLYFIRIIFSDLRMPKGDKYTPGDLVFAKVKGYPPWPARITGITSKDRQACFCCSQF